MQPELHHPDVTRDPILDGRDSLRLVKLRLALTLIAVAVLPIAAVSPLVRAVAEEARVTHHDRLVDQARIASGELESELGTLRKDTQALLDEPVMVAAAAQDATPAARKLASDRLQEFVSAPDSTLLSASLITGKGTRAGYGPAIDSKSLPPGVLVAGLAALPDNPARILVVDTSDHGSGPARTMVAAVSVSALLAAATPRANLPGRGAARPPRCRCDGQRPRRVDRPVRPGRAAG